MSDTEQHKRTRSASTSSTGSGSLVALTRQRSKCDQGVERVVVLAVDASDNAKNAFDWYLDNVHKADDLIVLTHCPEAPSLPTFSFKSGIAPPVDEWKKALDGMNDQTRKLEEDYEGTLIHKKLKYKVRGEMGFKKAGEGIIRVAEEEQADLIVLGSRGLGALKRALLGSTSEYVVRHASVPVTIIPYKKK